MAYHGSDKFAFTQYLGSDGTCSEPSPTPAPTPPTAAATCVNDSTNSAAAITVQYDASQELLFMFATVPAGSYVAWGWGKSMTNVEMVLFGANGDSSQVQSFYATGETQPGLAPKYDSCYTTSFEQDSTAGTVNFTASRPLECTDVANSYVVQLDTALDLIMAWNPSNPAMSFHDNNYKQFISTIESTGTCSGEAVNHNLQYYLHGIMMWTTWALIGLLQICTNRYWKTNWRWNRILHAILGVVSMGLTIAAAMIALSVGGWTISSESSLHAKFGLTIFIMGITLMFGGITALIVRVKVNMAWNTKTVLRIGMVHRWYGWGLVIVSQATIGTGAYNFYSYDGKDSIGWGIAGGSAGLFFTLLLVGEIRHQLRLRKEIAFVRPETTMTSAEFEQAIAAGRKLVILDELVLDVEKFTNQHPGGRFVLMHNIGRDISKFFYGGYSLEGNIGATKPAQGYAHSPIARMIVNDLAIAHYEPQKAVSSAICRVR